MNEMWKDENCVTAGAAEKGGWRAMAGGFLLKMQNILK